MDKNLILYDWLSFTTRENDPYYIANLIGLPDVPWELIKGAHGYHDRLYYGSISIHYNGREDMGCWCEMSGQGCRTFESYSDVSWPELFDSIANEHLKVTRLDVAYDDHIGLLDLNQIVSDVHAGEYVSKSRDWSITESSKGQTVDIGSPKSLVYIRIYDKAAERHCDPGTHWVRCELQLRDERAQSFVVMTEPQNPFTMALGDAYCGVVINYLRFVDPDPDDTNRWRWPIKDYWGNFLCNAQAIKLYSDPGVDYNLDRLKAYVVHQAGNAIDAYIKIKGLDSFLESIQCRPQRRNPKYDTLVAYYKDFKL